MALPKTFKPEGGQSRYTLQNLKSGDKVKIRVLSDFITGKSVWGEKDGKRAVTRVRDNDPMPVGAIGNNPNNGKPERVKQFIAATVYNYTLEQVEVFETDKASIIGQIFDIENNEDWGDSKGFDLTISKTGQDLDTKYSVLPSNPGKFTKDVNWEYVNLTALYSGDDPFADEQEVDEAEDVASDVPF